MKPTQPLIAAGISGEIAALIAALHDNAQRLEELTEGEVDTVADSEGRTFLLRPAQDHLRQHEAAKQAAIVDALPAHIALLDARGVIVSVNAAWRVFADANALIGPEYEIGVNYLGICESAEGEGAAEARQVAAGIRAVMSGKQSSFSLEYPCHAPDEQRWFLMSVTPLAKTRPHGVVVMHVNVTERKRNVEEVMRFAAAMDAVSDGIFMIDRVTMSYVHVNDTACCMLNLTRDALLALGPMKLLSKSRAELERDIDEGIASGIVPKPIEMLWSKSKDSPVWVELRHHVQKIGDRWTVITLVRDITERKHAELSLRESERRFSDMLGNVELVSIMLDVEARITYCNDYLLRLSGWKLDELIGKNAFEIFMPPESRPPEYTTFAALLTDSPDARHIERVLQTRSGERRLIRLNNSVLRSPSGEVIGVASLGEDITERKRAELRILRLNRVYAMQSGINTLIVRVHDREELFREACRVAVEAGAFMTAWIGVIDPQTLNGKVVAWYGADKPYVDSITLAVYGATEETEPPACRALRLGKSVICNDIATDPSLQPRRDIQLARGYKAVGCFPLKLNGEPEAVITLVAGERDFFDAEERLLLTELAANLSFALDNLEKAQRLAQAAAEKIRGEAILLRFKAAMDVTADAIYLVDRSSMSFIYVNDTACRMLDHTREEVMALGPYAVQQISRAELERTFDAIIASEVDAEPVEVQRSRKDGSQYWAELRRYAQRSEAGWTIITVVRDITARKAAGARITYLNRVYAMLSGVNTLIVRVREREELFREACRIAVEAGGFCMAVIAMVDSTTQKLVPVASAGTDDQLLQAVKPFASSEDQSATMLARAVREKKPVVVNDTKGDPQASFNQQYPESKLRAMAVFPLTVVDEVVGVFALYASEIDFFHGEELALFTGLAGDISFAIDHISKQEKLDYLAYYDSLTGLANRHLFLDRVAQFVRSAASGQHKLAVILIDLERFKNINDSLGRSAGDSLLRQAAEWLTRNAGDASLLARTGADHFAAVLPHVRSGGDLRQLIEKTMAAFVEHPFRLNEAIFRISVKVGIAIYPDDGADAETLFMNAEAALKRAKASGERALFYTQGMSAAVAAKLTLENQLRQAIDNEEFVLHYQPKVNLASGKMVSAEALIRWNDPRTGLVPPGRFIPILEETGLIYEVGRWAMRQAIADYLRWRTAGLPAVRLAVNVSPLQLRNRNFIDEVEHAITFDPLAAEGLELEITESLIMEDVNHSIASLKAIRAMGISIAIDDFGTGFSSLSYLAKLPVDTLKIDRSFVIEMTEGPQGLALVSTVISLAHALKLKVVAEGVETEEQQRLLRLLNCDEMQGYLFSRPVPADVFEAKFLMPVSG